MENTILINILKTFLIYLKSSFRLSFSDSLQQGFGSWNRAENIMMHLPKTKKQHRTCSYCLWNERGGLVALERKKRLVKIFYLQSFIGLRILSRNWLKGCSTSDFWKRVTGKEGVKKRWGFPILLFAIIFKGLNLNFTAFVENSVWVFFNTKMCFIGLRSRASLSISALRGRRGRYAHAYGICAPFYCLSLIIIYEWGGITMLGI